MRLNQGSISVCLHSSPSQSPVTTSCSWDCQLLQLGKLGSSSVDVLPRPGWVGMMLALPPDLLKSWSLAGFRHSCLHPWSCLPGDVTGLLSLFGWRLLYWQRHPPWSLSPPGPIPLLRVTLLSSAFTVVCYWVLIESLTLSRGASGKVGGCVWSPWYPTA